MDRLEWRKSSRSSSQGGDCVEVAEFSGSIGLRDSKHPGKGHQTVSRAAFAVLARRIKRNELDL
jgi:Domain of unknown function (DUF397).